MEYLKDMYSVLSILLCTVYSPYIRCNFCRKKTPPGLIMVPYSFGVAILSHHLLRLLLPRRSPTLTMFCQTVICLTIQNFSTFLWVVTDEFILRELAKRSYAEEEMLSYWWYTNIGIGFLTTFISLVLSKCRRGHIYFDNRYQIKPWACYWNRLACKKRVKFNTKPSVIPNT